MVAHVSSPLLIGCLVDHLFKVSVRDMVEARCPELRPLKEGEVLGNYYKLPDQRAYLSKPYTFKISASKDRDYLANVLKEKKLMPGPTQYNTGLNLLFKKNLSIYKRDRTSFCDDIARAAKHTPGVGAHNPIVKGKIKGSFKR